MAAPSGAASGSGAGSGTAGSGAGTPAGFGPVPSHGCASRKRCAIDSFSSSLYSGISTTSSRCRTSSAIASGPVAVAIHRTADRSNPTAAPASRGGDVLAACVDLQDDRDGVDERDDEAVRHQRRHPPRVHDPRSRVLRVAVLRPAWLPPNRFAVRRRPGRSRMPANRDALRAAPAGHRPRCLSVPGQADQAERAQPVPSAVSPDADALEDGFDASPWCQRRSRRRRRRRTGSRVVDVGAPPACPQRLAWSGRFRSALRHTAPARGADSGAPAADPPLRRQRRRRSIAGPDVHRLRRISDRSRSTFRWSAPARYSLSR